MKLSSLSQLAKVHEHPRFWFRHEGDSVRVYSSLLAYMSLTNKCLWVYDLKTTTKRQQNETNPSLQCVWTPSSACQTEGGQWRVLSSRVALFILQYLVCKRKLESKKEALLILSKELDTCQQERDQYKLMANQLRERHQSLKKKYRELIVRIASPWRPCFLLKRARFNVRAVSLERRWIHTVPKWKN